MGKNTVKTTSNEVIYPSSRYVIKYVYKVWCGEYSAQQTTLGKVDKNNNAPIKGRGLEGESATTNLV